MKPVFCLLKENGAPLMDQALGPVRTVCGKIKVGSTAHYERGFAVIEFLGSIRFE
jgi:hypothetical protein